ncbi:diguanylate cyclase domain-containing protein [Methyloceanibacter sp.]|uniref:diguanylate cyclase n=1 Tax=Methyloceanibacter sp. TaxID=1965321 RepID=UPI00351B1E4C
MRSPASTAKVPADRFKSINDSHGHEAGDEALRLSAAVARTPEALAGRLGGDEFALILNAANCRRPSRSRKRSASGSQRILCRPTKVTLT